MSHVIVVKAQIKDLAACEVACKRLGWKLVRGKQSFAWFGRWMDDYSGEDAAYRQGITPEEYGRCDHVIQVAGAEYEIGLKRQADGSFLAVFDNWRPGGLAGLTAANGLGGLLPLMQAEVTKTQLRRKGYVPVERKRADGKIVITVSA